MFNLEIIIEHTQENIICRPQGYQSLYFIMLKLSQFFSLSQGTTLISLTLLR